MSWNNLPENEKDMVLKCLIAATEGPFFPDWEFGTIMCCNRDKIREVINKWDELDKSSDEITTIMISVMNNLTGYPHREEEALKQYVSVDEATLREIMDKLIHRTVDDEI